MRHVRMAKRGNCRSHDRMVGARWAEILNCCKSLASRESFTQGTFVTCISGATILFLCPCTYKYSGCSKLFSTFLGSSSFAPYNHVFLSAVQTFARGSMATLRLFIQSTINIRPSPPPHPPPYGCCSKGPHCEPLPPFYAPSPFC